MVLFYLFFVIEKTERKESLQDGEFLVIGTFRKLFICFARCSTKLPLEQCSSYSSSICSQFQRGWRAESDCLIHDAVAVHLF